jgi:hypothetical protein
LQAKEGAGTLSSTMGGLPVDDLPGDVRKNVITQCESQACKDAKNALIVLRNKILGLCTDLHAHESARTSYGATAIGLAAAAGGVAAAAFAAPWPLNLVLGIIASVIATVATVFFILYLHEQHMCNIYNTLIANAQQEFKDAVDTMIAACPEQCRGDATLPLC